MACSSYLSTSVQSTCFQGTRKVVFLHGILAPCPWTWVLQLGHLSLDGKGSFCSLQYLLLVSNSVRGMGYRPPPCVCGIVKYSSALGGEEPRGSLASALIACWLVQLPEPEHKLWLSWQGRDEHPCCRDFFSKAAVMNARGPDVHRGLHQPCILSAAILC